jgi:hypothetical protein
MISTRTSRIASLAMFALAGVGTAFALSGPAAASNQVQCTGTTTPIATSGSIGTSSGTPAAAGVTTQHGTTGHNSLVHVGVGTPSTSAATITASGSGTTTGTTTPSATGSSGISVNAGSVGANDSLGGVVNGIIGGVTHKGKGLLGTVTGSVGTGNGLLGSGNGLLGGLNLFGTASTSANQSGGLSVSANADANGTNN